MTNRVHIAIPRRARASGVRRRRISIWQSWVLLSDDPPGLCCGGDELCPACAI